jgi:hypothetical protein
MDRQYGWLEMEITFISSSPYGRKMEAWQRRSFANTVVKLNQLQHDKLSRIAAETIQALEYRVTLRTIAETFDTPYQSVRRYAAAHNWTRKRSKLWAEVAKGVRERLRQQMGS